MQILSSRSQVRFESLHFYANKGPYSQIYGFSSRRVWMWELDHKGGWRPKNWCFQTVVLRKTLESLLDSKEIKPINPKGNQPWIFIGRTDAKPKLQYFDHLMQRADSFEKIWCWERMRAEGEGADRGWDGWIESLTQWTWVSKLQETVKDREVRCDAVYRVAKSQTWLNDSATITSTQVMLLHKYILELLSEWQGTIPEMLNMVELEDSLNPD